MSACCGNRECTGGLSLSEDWLGMSDVGSKGRSNPFDLWYLCMRGYEGPEQEATFDYCRCYSEVRCNSRSFRFLSHGLSRSLHRSLAGPKFEAIEPKSPSVHPKSGTMMDHEVCGPLSDIGENRAGGPSEKPWLPL